MNMASDMLYIPWMGKLGDHTIEEISFGSVVIAVATGEQLQKQLCSNRLGDHPLPNPVPK